MDLQCGDERQEEGEKNEKQVYYAHTDTYSVRPFNLMEQK